jgi:hypothetical protein
MASSGKRKTTFAKLARESRLRERRLEKQAKRDARRQASKNEPPQSGDLPAGNAGATNGPGSPQGEA